MTFRPSHSLRRLVAWIRGTRINRAERHAKFRRPWIEALEDRLAPAVDTWNITGSGNWDTAANWSTGNVPGSSDTAVIQTAAAATITIQSGDSITVQSVTTAAN